MECSFAFKLVARGGLQRNASYELELSQLASLEKYGHVCTQARTNAPAYKTQTNTNT